MSLDKLLRLEMSLHIQLPSQTRGPRGPPRGRAAGAVREHWKVAGC